MTNEKLDELIERLHETLHVVQTDGADWACDLENLLEDCKTALIEAKKANEVK